MSDPQCVAKERKIEKALGRDSTVNVRLAYRLRFAVDPSDSSSDVEDNDGDDEHDENQSANDDGA